MDRAEAGGRVRVVRRLRGAAASPRHHLLRPRDRPRAGRPAALPHREQRLQALDP